MALCVGTLHTAPHWQPGNRINSLMLLPTPAVSQPWMHSQPCTTRGLVHRQQSGFPVCLGTWPSRRSQGTARLLSRHSSQVSAHASSGKISPVAGAAAAVCQAVEVAALLTATYSTVQLVTTASTLHQQQATSHSSTSSTATISSQHSRTHSAQTVWQAAPRGQQWVAVCPEVVSQGAHWLILQVVAVSGMLLARAAGQLLSSITRYWQAGAAPASLSEQATLASITAAHVTQGNRMSDLERHMTKLQLASRVSRQDVMKPLHQVQSGLAQQSELVAQLSKAVETLHKEVIDTQRLLVASQTTSAKQFQVMVKAFESVQREQAAVRDRVNKAAAVIELLKQQQQQQQGQRGGGGGGGGGGAAPGLSSGPGLLYTIPDPWLPKQPLHPPNTGSAATGRQASRQATQQAGTTTNGRKPAQSAAPQSTSTATKPATNGISATAAATTTAAGGPAPDLPRASSHLESATHGQHSASREPHVADDTSAQLPVKPAAQQVHEQQHQIADQAVPPSQAGAGDVQGSHGESPSGLANQAQHTPSGTHVVSPDTAPAKEGSPVAWEAWTERGRLMAWTYRGDPC